MENDARTAADRISGEVTGSAQNLAAVARPSTEDLAAGTERALNRVGKATPEFDGMAVIDKNNGASLATRGDDVPAASASPQPGDVTTSVVGNQVVTTVALTPTRSLVAVSTPDLQPPAPQRRLLLVDGAGSIASQSGSRPTVPNDLLTAAAGRSSGGQPGTVVDENALHTRDSALGFLDLGNDPKPPVAMVGFAPLTGAAASTGLSVLSVGSTVPIAGAVSHPGLVAGAALAGAGVLAFLLLQGLLVRPVRRLRDDVHDLIDPPSGTALGSTTIRRSRLREADRVAVGLLTHLRRDPGKHTATVPLAAVVGLVALLLAAPIAAGFFLIAHDSTRPDLMVQRHQSAVESTTQRLDSTLTGGLDALQAIAVPDMGSTRGQWQDRLDAVAEAHPEFRSVYAQDTSGATVAHAGESPTSKETDRSTPLGIEQVNTSGSTPIVMASAQTSSGRYTVRGEFDPRKLNDVLRQNNAPTRVVDDRMRTILSSSGYLAFSELDKSTLRDAAATASPTPDSAIRPVDDADAVISTQRLGSTDATESLHWVVLQDQGLESAKYSSDSTTKAATVVLLVTAALAVAAVIWLVVTTVLPMRRVAANADLIRSGRAAHEEAPIVSAQRLDEIGAVAAGLNHYAVHFSGGTDPRTRG